MTDAAIKSSLTWDELFMKIAIDVAEKSKDPSTKVGCVLVDKNKSFRSMGFNGIPKGVSDLPERLERPEKYNWVCHAEENAITQAAREGTSIDGSIAYVTHFPCPRCAGMLINSGIVEVVVGTGKTNSASIDFEYSNTKFHEAGVKVRYI